MQPARTDRRKGCIVTGRIANKPASASGPGPRIWACGGGKGGVGKSVLAANLAVALAKSGKSCILLDADLGGANLHTLFGIAHPGNSLSDLFTRKADHLRELPVATGIPGLQLISGARPLMDMANVPHAQKLKLLRQLTTLDVDYLLIDLGAGSTFNVLDFSLVAALQMLVVTPLPTSVENAYHFLKAGYFRRLKKLVRQEGLEGQADGLLRDRRTLGIRFPGELLTEIRKLSPRRGAAVARGMRSFMPQILVNQARSAEDRGLGPKMARAAGDYFGLPVGSLGSIPHDDRVHAAVQKKRPVLETFPQAAFSLAVHDLARRLLQTEEGFDVRNRSTR